MWWSKKNEYEKEILNEEKLKKEEKNKISNFIKNYGKEVGLPNLCLNNENICSLNFDGKINIDIKYNEKSSICPFVSPICSIPDKNKEEFYKKLLLANSFGIENGGAVLSIYKEKNSIIFSFSFIVSTFSYELLKMFWIISPQLRKKTWINMKKCLIKIKFNKKYLICIYILKFFKFYNIFFSNIHKIF